MNNITSNSTVLNFAILGSENPLGVREENGLTERLIRELKTGHCKYFPIKKESSVRQAFIIYNVSISDAKRLAEFYKYGSLIYAVPIANMRHIRIEYWKRTPPKASLRKQNVVDEYIAAANADEFYTQVGNLFKLEIPIYEQVKEINEGLLLKKIHRTDVQRYLEESVNDVFTGKHQWLCRCRLYD